eukprot:SAG11_NODE_9847_length_876_cov_1.592021_1_plen_56_part_10
MFEYTDTGWYIFLLCLSVLSITGHYVTLLAHWCLSYPPQRSHTFTPLHCSTLLGRK